LLNTSIPQGQTNAVPVRLEAHGNENALGFSVVFDPANLSFAGALTGTGASGATLNVNTNQMRAGRIGLALAWPPGSTAGTGAQVVVNLRFVATVPAPANTTSAFGDQPVPREVSDALANPLVTTYNSGTVSVTPPPGPPLSFTRSGRTLFLAWPADATGFELEATEGELGTAWSPVPGAIVLGAQKIVAVMIEGNERYFRLRKP
jgi:hypothetical protein